MKKLQEDYDIKHRRMMRYWDLLLKYWEIKEVLWREFPEKMGENAKKTAMIWLDRGLIKCKHER